ncbi:Rha family transcriptional regulator [Niallia circulans]|uniref:Rha family transcriptional regulator n=1 Tax=Niallia circulans TaxID=1397 RepID=A0A941JJP6_NIACI|nr:Rha family transcriptional regulator [Niallia circulans]MCB5235477.1 Rha family transcriptional regulator [Niallia circulans]
MDLVFVDSGQVFTDSLTVAEVFGKQHKDVMRDIRNLECSEEFNQRNFAPIDYTDDRNRTYRKYLIKRDGLAFLVFGYTGSKAAEYKEKYIQAFNSMEEELKKPKALSEREQLIASMKLSLETAEEISHIKSDLDIVKHQVSEELTLNHGQQQTLHHEIKKRVESIKNDYELTKRELYSQIHSHLRRAFAAPKYVFVKRKDFDEALSWVKSWRPLI